MLTVAERNSLLLSLGFLLIGAGIKAWKKWHVEIGPFHPATSSASLVDRAQTGVAPPAAPEGSTPTDSTRANPVAAATVDTTLAIAAEPPTSAIPGDDRSRSTSPADRKPARRGKAKAPKAVSACPVDVNNASESRLANLPGVGPRTATAIAAHRKINGPFRDIRDLLQVKGIGEKKLALIAPCLILSETGARPLPAQASADPERDGEARPARP